MSDDYGAYWGPQYYCKCFQCTEVIEASGYNNRFGGSYITVEGFKADGKWHCSKKCAKKTLLAALKKLESKR